MSLFKRGNVFWVYVWMDGVRHHKSTGTPNRRKAELIEQQFKEELNLRRHHLKELEPNLTFGELAARFLANGSKAWHVDRLKVPAPVFRRNPDCPHFQVHCPRAPPAASSRKTAHRNYREPGPRMPQAHPLLGR